MAMNRKGVFFTIMALLIIAFLLTSESLISTPLTASLADTSAANSRVTVMNSFIDTFESQASSSLATAGYFALQNISSGIQKDGSFITDMNTTVDHCIRVQPQNCMYNNQSLNTTLNTLIALGRTNFSINTTYTIEKVWVSEDRPFEVIFWMNISYNISDPFANWTVTTKTLSAPVDVTGILDPAYARANSSNVTITRVFSRTSTRYGQFSNSTFYQYYEGRQYIANPGVNAPGTYHFGPSVLQRYAGDLLNGSACCGIESVVYFYGINATLRNDPQLVNWSFVDYLFFSRETIAPFSCASISSTGSSKFNSTVAPQFYATLRLDNYHMNNIYENMSAYRNSTCQI